MDHPPDRYRLAIAALEAPDRLRAAVDELGAHSFTGSELCLAGTPAAIEVIRQAGPYPAGNLIPQLLEVEPLPLVTGQAAWMATSGRPLTTLKKTAPLPGAAPGDSRCWIGQPSRDALVDRMASGDVVLLAGPLTAEQLMVATRVMLRHSHHPVQSHLIAPAVWRRP